jgi:hypothetical protein
MANEIMDFLTGNQDTITGALGGLGSYYLSQENIKGAQASGEQARMLSEQAGQQARDYSTFKPYTVFLSFGSATMRE